VWLRRDDGTVAVCDARTHRRRGDGAATAWRWRGNVLRRRGNYYGDGVATGTGAARRGAATALQNRGDRYGDGVAALAWLQVRR